MNAVSFNMLNILFSIVKLFKKIVNLPCKFFRDKHLYFQSVIFHKFMIRKSNIDQQISDIQSMKGEIKIDEAS